MELIDEANTEIPLPTAPAALTLQDVDKATDLHIVGTFECIFVLADRRTPPCALEGLRTLSPVSLPKVLYCTHTRNLCSLHLALEDSYQLYTATLPAAVFPKEVPAQHQRIPKNIQQALSPEFMDEWSGH